MSLIIYYLLPVFTIGMLAWYLAERRKSPARKGRTALLLGGAILIPSLLFMLLVATDPASNLVLTGVELVTASDGAKVVRGSVANRTDDRAFSEVRVDVDLLNASDSVIRTSVVRTELISPGQSWSFAAPAQGPEVVDFRVRVSSPDNRRAF